MIKNFRKYLVILSILMFAILNWHLDVLHFKDVNENLIQKSFFKHGQSFDFKNASFQLQNTFKKCKNNTHNDQYKNSYIDHHDSNAELLETDTELENPNFSHRKNIDFFFKTNLSKVLFSFLTDFYSQKSATFFTHNLSINKFTEGLYIAYRVFRL